MAEVEEPTEYLEDEEEEETEVVNEEEAGENQEEQYDTGYAVSKLQDVQDKEFVEVKLPADVVTEAQQAWQTFIGTAGSREAAGEATYGAFYESAPSLQSLFKTARSVMAMRFMNGLNSIISSAADPSALKVQTETLGFQHLDFEVTVPRVIVFRDAIIDLFKMEMGARFNSKAELAFRLLLNYVGGAYIYVRREYAVRIRIINSSWRTATDKAADFMDQGEEGAVQGEAGEGEGEGEEGEEATTADATKKEETGLDAKVSTEQVRATATASGEVSNKNNMKVPTTFNEMFIFNSAVMGFGSSTWMSIILEQFDNIAVNVSNSYRLQEECDVLALVLAKYRGTIVLSEFKAVMLASLRSLVPKDWDSDHEVAWGWLWENVERMLKNLMGKPQLQEKALDTFIMSLTEDAVNYLRREIFKRFFALAPAGQDFFKMSLTRLYWIADKIVQMTIDMYREPRRMVEDISALGLRHVAYATPTEFFGPFVVAAVQVVSTMTTDETAEDAFRWSLTLISKVLVRTILEGSTIVMMAINTNQEAALKKAISVAPRGRRAMELLNITVGTQSISPLYWSIESGSLNCAQAMLADLLTIRADRDRYYYGCDELFTRHPEVVQRLCADAASLLPTLLNSLVWRSRLTIAAHRRVNYFVKHFIQDEDDKFNKALEWLADGQDPKIICHPVVVLCSDMIWGRLASRFFFMGRCYFILALIVFITSQSILQHLNDGKESEAIRIATFACRVYIYVGSMGHLLISQMKRFISDCKRNSFVSLGCIKVPEYLGEMQSLGSLALLVILCLMCAQEPIFYCLTESAGSGDLFTQNCQAMQNSGRKEAYAALTMFAMLLYWALLLDLTIFSMRISAYTLVCGRVLSELGLFIGSMCFLILAFSSSISAFKHKSKDFAGIPKGALSLLEIALGMFPTEHITQIQEDVPVLVAVSLFVITVIIFLVNLLVAQLNGAYHAVYEDMVGYARLNRASIIVSTIPGIPVKRWDRFLASLKLEERLEFNEGDVGLAGGIQVLEPSNVNPVTVDAIRRFGGSTSPKMPWPQEDGVDEDDKFERLEKALLRATKKMSGKGGKKTGAGSSSAGVSGGSSSGAASGGADE